MENNTTTVLVAHPVERPSILHVSDHPWIIVNNVG